VAPRTTGATLEAAAVKTAIAVDPVVAAEGCTARCRAFGVGRTRASQCDVSTAAIGAKWSTDSLRAVESAAALSAGGATSAFIAAAVQGTVTGYSIVFAEDRTASLAALASGGTLTTKSDAASTATTSATDTIDAAQTAAADDITIAPTAVVVTAVQHAVRVDPVRGADRGSGGLTALSGLGTRGTERQTTSSVVRTDIVDTVETTATPGAVVTACARTAFITATVQGAVAVKAVVSADGGPTGLTALLR
jgi:hypothetical protein